MSFVVRPPPRRSGHTDTPHKNFVQSACPRTWSRYGVNSTWPSSSSPSKAPMPPPSLKYVPK